MPETDPTERRARNKRLLLGLVAATLAGGLVKGVFDHLQKRDFTATSEAWLNKARSFGSAGLTPSDARDWLRESGFHVIVWNPHSPNGYMAARSRSDAPEDLIVVGERTLQPTWPGQEPRYLRLSFVFDLDRTYRHPEVDLWPITMKRGEPNTRTGEQAGSDG
jgi:hypothetical protein